MLSKIMHNLNRLKQKMLGSSKKGQSLVEIAISMPILIFLLIGVFEVGSALRSYLVLVNVNREITRFAVRPGYLDFSTEDTIKTSYESVLNWANTSNTSQLDLDFDDTTGSSTLIVSHVVVNTGIPCADKKGEPITDCDCDKFDDPTYPTFENDDIIIHPGMEGKGYQAQSFGPAATSTGDRATKIDYDSLTTELTKENNKFNCEILKKGGVPSSNNVIVTELFHDQPQLFGFPLISNPFTDPVPLYTHTVMRLLEGTRGINQNTIGPYCMAYPFTMHVDELLGAVEGVTQVDILGGPDSGGGTGGNRGFLAWDPQANSTDDLQYELQFSQMAANSYRNPYPGKEDDTTLNVGDWVASLQGNNAGVNSPPDSYYIDALAGEPIIIPVYDDLQSLSNPNPPPAKVEAYHIVKFIKVKIIAGSVNLSSSNGGPEVKALIIDLDPEECK